MVNKIPGEPAAYITLPRLSTKRPENEKMPAGISCTIETSLRQVVKMFWTPVEFPLECPSSFILGFISSLSFFFVP
jgi:hypothetical protein